MAYKQEPCPLCGRNMTAIETYPGRGELYCGHCDLTIGGNDAKTPEELIALMDSSEHRRLKTENAKLREVCRRYMRRIVPELCEQNAELHRENATLRTQLADVTESMGRVEERCAKLRESLERAAGIIADSCGECPVSRYEWLSSDGCAEKCGTITEDECWIAYLTGKRWDESGAEVDE